LRPRRGWLAALVTLLACGGSKATKPISTDSAATPRPVDSLVLTSPAGVEVWFTLARAASAADGKRCLERGLEIRQGSGRIQVPLLYTGSRPVLLDDSTMQATLWTHCVPGDSYRVNLRSGRPVRVGATP